MSFSEPTLTNPAQYRFEWNGGNGTLSFYNKESGKTITIPFSPDRPFEFLVLDQLNEVTGWSDHDNRSIWSNETKSTRDDFTVRAGKRVLYVGPYKNEQGINQVAGFGGKYAKSIYTGNKDKTGEWSINRLRLTGAALNAWIDFAGAHNFSKGKVRITGSIEGKKGATVFRIPVFEYVKLTDDEIQAGNDLDRQLQHHLKQYLVAPKFDENTGEDLTDGFNTDGGYASREQQDEFEQLKAKAGIAKPENEEDVQSLYNSIAEGEPIDESEIPF